MRLLPLLPRLLLLLLAAPPRATAQQASAPTPRPGVIVVSPTAGATPLTDALRRAPAGARVVVAAGTYREPTLVIDRPLVLEGRPGAVIDGGGTHTVLLVTADDVTVRGLVVRNTGPSHTEERAGIRVENAARCRIEDNRVERTLFAVYLSRTSSCAVSRNVIHGAGLAQMMSGNGIHVWQSDSVTVADNDIDGHRDGIYFEFVTAGRVHDNRSLRSARYGMHFMFSDDCTYERNTYRENANGIAVMYSKRVAMIGNRFERNWGSAAYGLLLKDISDSRIVDNEFAGNSVGLYLEDANRNQVLGNTFRENGWALKVMANATDNEFRGNSFVANAFDVATNSRSNYSRFEGNYWDRYRGYDLDRDGIGDVPHPPVRLFALVVAKSPPTLVLLRSVLVDLLDAAERIIPSLTPETLVDARPLVRPPRVSSSTPTRLARGSDS